MEPSPPSPTRPSDLTIRKIAAFDARLQCYTPQYTFLLAYISTNIFLFFHSAVPEFSQWPHDPYRAWFISIARGFGYILNFNVAIQMILPCSKLLTFLRRTRLSLLFPFDHSMPEMHTVVGITSFITAILHSIFHLIVGVRANMWLPGWGKSIHLLVTGVAVLLVFFALVITSIPVVRNRKFEVFSVFHLTCTALLLSLLHFHGLHKGYPATYKWILGPALLYLLDRVVVMMTVKVRSVKVKFGSECKSLIYDGGIVRLYFQKPFEYRAGQYAKLCIPLISKTQWHPFTFASAPHEEKVLFFIKQKGDWTTKLHDICKGGLNIQNSGNLFRFEVKIRGPYGSPAEHAAQYDRVLLISGGVGATPFCSLTKEMTNDFLRKVKEDTTNRYASSSDSSSGEQQRAWRCSFVNEPGPELFNIGKTALPNAFPQPQRKSKFSNSGNPVFLGSSRRGRRESSSLDKESHVPSQTWALLCYTISNTSTFNSIMLWILTVRLFVDLMSVAFGFSDLGRQGSEIFESNGLAIGDFILACVFLAGLCFAIVSEAVSENRVFPEEVLISIPLSIVPVLLGILAVFGKEIGNGSLTLYYFVIIWPMTILLFLLRYFRSLGERALLSGTVKGEHEPCMSVDFIWTARTREEDVWLVEELYPTVRRTKFVRLHRFITRESEREDIEARFNGRHGMLCHYGRPQWDDIFQQFTKNVRSGSTVGIFFCGPAEMAAAVKKAATLSMFESRYRGMRKNGNDAQGPYEDPVARSFNVRYVFRQERF